MALRRLTHVEHPIETTLTKSSSATNVRWNFKCTYTPYMHVSHSVIINRTSCVQRSSLSLWCKRKLIAWLSCRSLAGQVRPMQTQFTHATRQRLWFNDGHLWVDRVVYSERLCPSVRLSLRCSLTLTRSWASHRETAGGWWLWCDTSITRCAGCRC